MHIFVVIPVHNRLELTRACLASLQEQTCRDFTVVVVDDGSCDGTGEALARESPETAIVAGDGSLWWAGAMNAGVGWVLAQAEKQDVVLSLNNDTVCPPDYLEGLVRAHAAAPDALIGSLLVSATDRATILDGGVTVGWATAKYRTAGRGETMRVRAGDGPDLRSVDVVSGCGTLIPVGVLRRVGPYAERRLRHYAADYEFSRRALRADSDLFVDWASPLYVWEEETGMHASVDGAGLTGLLRSFWDVRSANDFRNRWWFAIAACPRAALPLYLPCDYVRVVVGTLRRRFSGLRKR